jgi:hypothetical protein
MPEAIQLHAEQTTNDGYGSFTIKAKQALESLPRFEP